jgi:RsiW-degrading membrane proteinase PrsW (M82 family)
MFARIVTLLFGLLGTLLGLLLIGFGLFGAIGGGRTAEQFIGSASSFPLGVLLLELGLASAWFAWLRARGMTTRSLTLPPWWACAAAFLIAVLLGWGALRLGWWWAFLPVATVATFAPIVATGRLGLPWGDGRPSWGRILPAFAWGALVTPLVAITLQLIGAIGAFGAAVLGYSLGDQRSLDTLLNIVRHLQGRTLTDGQTAALTQIVVKQPIVLLVGAFILVFIGPVTEELGKFGAVLLFSRTRADRLERDSTLTIFLIGLASGLGFAATENIFYAAQSGSGGWTGLIFTRAVTPIMHGTASALFALGWAQQRRNPQGWGLLRGAALSLGLHSVWNLCAGMLIVSLLFVSSGGATAGLAVLLTVLVFATLAALAIGSIMTLLRLRRTLTAETAAGVAVSAAALAVPAAGSPSAALSAVPIPVMVLPPGAATPAPRSDY